ncbi:MAG: NgoFVII family restriction endonuclease [Clostridiales bacterium]|nr:NgoFVII family restriction endonuclease [Clostridiales bacterium]
MYFENLYEEILINPLLQNDFNKLLIVSGYATAAMSFHYLNELREKSKDIKLHLIVGMTSKDGLTSSNHNGFKKLATDEFSNKFRCSYITSNPPVHSKVYIWCRDDKPVLAFAGSANYTQTAFCLHSQRETMTSCNPNSSADYFKMLLKETVFCEHPEAEEFITIYRDSLRRKEYQTGMADEAEYDVNDYLSLPSVTVSLLDSNGNLPQRSGLNWGQRPEEGREPNQAYIRLTSDIYHTDFFPPVSVHFTLFTDDGKTLICTRAQQNGKAIHTPHNNSLIGEYFRNRLGLPNGEAVLTNHLIKYGRTDLTFYKIDDETYYMDFAP